MDTGCPHPEPDITRFELADDASVHWCSLCGSVREGALSPWVAPASLVLPGWTCRNCKTFNGSAKEVLTVCRHCQAPRKPAMEQRDENG